MSIFREFAWYEGYKRYAEMAVILKEKYGDRLKDLAPTWSGWTWIGGDYSPGLAEAKHQQHLLFGVPDPLRREPVHGKNTAAGWFACGWMIAICIWDWRRQSLPKGWRMVKPASSTAAKNV